jgi:hypothetical protein
MKLIRFTLCVAPLLALTSLAFAQEEILKELESGLSADRPSMSADSKVDVSTTQAWTDAKIDLQPGDQLTITASAGNNCNPAGESGKKASGTLPIASATPGALIAKTSDSGTPQLVGASNTITASDAGHLYLGPNGTGVCSGTFAVSIHQTSNQGAKLKSQLAAAGEEFLKGQFGTPSTAASTAADAAKLNVSTSPLDPALKKMIDGFPRRVNDQSHNLGDMTNFVLIGSEDQVKNALAAANWHPADTSDTGAVLAAAMATYQNKDYLAMPMSTLYLFNRPQDFGYEMADPIAMVATRNHFRIWKAPQTYKGQTVWVGAGTHDIAFAKDQRNNGITHKVDPYVDGERTNIGSSLEKAGKVASMYYYLPPNPVQDAKVATGDSYHSDGRVLVIFLK